MDPTVDVISKREPEGLDVAIERGVEHLLGGFFVGIQQPSYETNPYRERLLPKVRETLPSIC